MQSGDKVKGLHITVENSLNPSSVYIRLCKHRKKVFYSGMLRHGSPYMMYQEFVYQNTENSTPFNFKSVSTWQEGPNAHVQST